MKFEIWLVGKTKEDWIASGVKQYTRKCERDCKIEYRVIKASGRTDPEAIRKEESENLLAKLDAAKGGYNILLDERGREMTSVQFADQLQDLAANSRLPVRFLTGGAYGVTPELRQRADKVIAFSKMIFTHELIRVILLEQLYRALQILKGSAYHHK